MLELTTSLRPFPAGTRVRSGPAFGFVALALCATTLSAPAAALQISCEQETVGIPAWTAPLVVTYDGGESGTLSVKSDHIELSLDATYTTRPEDGAKVIDGAGEVAVTMPDLALLDACTAGRMPADSRTTPISIS